MSGFTTYQDSRWVWQSQHLPEGEMIKRADAISAMREFGLALKDRHRVVLVPALLMLTGGVIATFGGTKSRKTDDNTATPMKI